MEAFARRILDGKPLRRGFNPVSHAVGYFCQRALWRRHENGKKDRLRIDPSRCTGCGLCAGNCPAANLRVEKGKAVPAGRCILCYRCVNLCPVRAVTLLGANVLRLRPCIEVRDGKMLVGKKFRGSLPKVISAYVRDRLNGRDDLDLSRIFITHTCDDPALIESVRKEILQYAPFAEILDTYAGCTVASHCGPGTLGILFLRKQ